MIVVDTNVITYLVIEGQQTRIAERIMEADHEWIAPYLWRSEFRNALVKYLRRDLISLDEAHEYMRIAVKVMGGSEYAVPSAAVLALANRSRLSAYDCEFVVLARLRRLPLITADQKIVTEFPQIAVSMERFA